jgi:hypothetical protein
MINYIPFNVNILTKKYKKDNWRITDGFEYLLNDEKIFNEQKGIICKKCQKVTVHKESKFFYYTAKNIIIILNRGENCENKTFIDFDEKLKLLNIEYQLTGIIELKDDGEYISFTRNENNTWSYNGDKNNKMPFNGLKCLGTVVSLFYYCDDDNMILQSDSSYVQQFNNLSLSQRNVNINPSNLINSNINNASFNNSQSNIFSNNNNNLNMINSYNSVNINPMNNMNIGQPNINYQYPIYNMNQYVIQNNINNTYNNNNLNYNNYNMQGANFIGQMNMNYNNNIQINNFQGGNFSNLNYNNNFH